MSTTKTLVLTRDFQAHKIVQYERALLMLFQGKIRVVEEYAGNEHIVGVIPPKRQRDFRQVVAAFGARFADNGDLILRTPSVVSLLNPIGNIKRGVKFSRINIFTRDGFRCQYCGEQKRMSALNYDHVKPRVQGGKTVWENIVTACYPCNSKKANRTPEQAGMKLLRQPHKPKSLPMTGPRFDHQEMNVAWIPYLGPAWDTVDLLDERVA
jgi:HNH endonuclease